MNLSTFSLTGAKNISRLLSTLARKVKFADMEEVAAWRDFMFPSSLVATPILAQAQPGARLSPTHRTEAAAKCAAGSASTSPHTGERLQSSRHELDIESVMQKQHKNPAQERILTHDARANLERSVDRSEQKVASSDCQQSLCGSSSAGLSPSLPVRGRTVVERSTPFDVVPGVTAEEVLVTLRIHARRLRVTKDIEAEAEK